MISEPEILSWAREEGGRVRSEMYNLGWTRHTTAEGGDRASLQGAIQKQCGTNVLFSRRVIGEKVIRKICRIQVLGKDASYGIDDNAAWPQMFSFDFRPRGRLYEASNKIHSKEKENSSVKMKSMRML